MQLRRSARPSSRCARATDLSDTSPQPAVEAETKGVLFDLGDIDLSATFADGPAIERVIPHRGAMRLLDRVVWVADDFRSAVGVREVRDDEFWVPGHFPQLAMFPGVLMVESGAQLAAFVWNKQQPEPKLAAFLRIDRCVFRRSVTPGEDLMLLCVEVKKSKRRFVTDVQGLVEGDIAFEAQITGFALDAMEMPIS